MGLQPRPAKGEKQDSAPPILTENELFPQKFRKIPYGRFNKIIIYPITMI